MLAVIMGDDLWVDGGKDGWIGPVFVAYGTLFSTTKAVTALTVEKQWR